MTDNLQLSTPTEIFTIPKDLFSTNRAPSDEEYAQLTDLVDELTMKISELEEQIQRLTTEKTALLETVTPFKRVLSPFRRLPEDVLREIFVACLDPHRNPTMARTEAPVLLTQISSSMRRVALSTPALWAAIHIPVLGNVAELFINTARPVMARRTDGVREWLRRAGEMPLRISAHEVSGYGAGTNDLGEETIDILLACCARWSEVCFSFSQVSLVRIAALTAEDVPLLRVAYLEMRTSMLGGINLWEGNTMLAAAHLTSFSMKLTRAPDRIYDYAMHWENITELALMGGGMWLMGDNDMNGLADILRRTTRLASCTLTVFHTSREYISDISLPHLTVLKVIENIADWGEFPGILAAIRAPTLEAIKYATSIQFSSNAPSLISLLQQAPNVTELWLGYYYITSFTLRQCLGLAPSLNILDIQGSGASFIDTDDAFFAALVHEDSTQCLCPKLEYFSCNTVLSMSLEYLRSFIMRKAGGVDHLKRWKDVVMQVMYDPLDQHLVEEFELPAGMCLRISFLQRPGLRSPLDQGLRRREEADEWWPSKFTLPMLA